MAASLLNRASLSQQIRDALLDRILSGSLKPGDRLIELKIAEEMQTSQAPVREAIKELEAIGVIETQRNKGARVRVIDKKELVEIYHVRAELEALAGEIVAGSARDTAKALDNILSRMKKVAESGNSLRFAEINSEFHSTIVQASGNQTLIGLWNGLHVRARTSVKLARSATDLVNLAQAHNEIVEAIRSGDTAKAREASWQHVRQNAPAARVFHAGQTEFET